MNSLGDLIRAMYPRLFVTEAAIASVPKTKFFVLVQVGTQRWHEQAETREAAQEKVNKHLTDKQASGLGIYDIEKKELSMLVGDNAIFENYLKRFK